MSPSSTACADATWAAPLRKPSQKVNAQVQLPRGYHIDWEGEYESEKRAQARLARDRAADDPADSSSSSTRCFVRSNGLR